jgi:hypothetical protein
MTFRTHGVELFPLPAFSNRLSVVDDEFYGAIHDEEQSDCCREGRNIPLSLKDLTSPIIGRF